MSQAFTKQCEQLLNDFNGQRVKNFLEVVMLHPESGRQYIFTIQRKEGLSPAEKCAKLEDRIKELEES